MSRTNENDERYPRDAEHRYRVYVLCPCVACSGTGKDEDGARCTLCRGEGKTRDVVGAAPDPESLGVMLVTVAAEGQLDECANGVLDTCPPCDECAGVGCETCDGTGIRKTGRWLWRPWLPSPRNWSDAGRVLASARQK